MILFTDVFRTITKKRFQISTYCLTTLEIFVNQIRNNLRKDYQEDNTVKLDFKELLIKEQIDFKELFTDYQLFYTINILLNKELLLI